MSRQLNASELNASEQPQTRAKQCPEAIVRGNGCSAITLSIHTHIWLCPQSNPSSLHSLTYSSYTCCCDSEGSFLLISGGIYVLESRCRGCSRLFKDQKPQYTFRHSWDSPSHMAHGPKSLWKTAVCSTPDVVIFFFDSRGCHVSAPAALP
jgi:hypothetical protein